MTAGDDGRWPISRELTIYLIIALIVGAPVVGSALTFNATSEAGAEWEATPNGPTVYFDENRELPSGDPFPASNSIHIQTAQGSAYYNGTANTRARIDAINGTWSNVSQLDVTAGNLTINPQGAGEAKITGDADSFKFNGTAEVNDGVIDAVVSGNSGTAQITLTTDGTQGEDYALIDTQTNSILSVGAADANGVVEWDPISLSTHKLSVEEVGNITIREATANHPKVTNANVSIKFFGPDGDEITELQDGDGDGVIDLSGSGLSLDKEFSAQVTADGHDQQTTIIEDLSQQNTIFILNQTDNLDKEFIVEDQTGNFDGEDTDLIIQRPINTTHYGGGEGITYKNVRGDRIGADRAFETVVQKDVRYRIVIRNDKGDTRQLGAYTPKTAGTTTFKVQAVNVTQTDQTDIRFNVSYNDTASPDQITVRYNDTKDQTDTLWVEIYERNNRSNKLLANTSYAGPLGAVSVTQTVPDAKNETDWMVRVTADRSDARDFNALVPLSRTEDLLPGMPVWLMSVLSVGLFWVTAGLFSQINGDVGGLVIAGEGAIFWFMGIAPPSLGVGVVILAMVTAGLLFINERRDGGL